METVFHNFSISAPLKDVFQAISTAEGLNSWWSKSCSGITALGEEYEMGFGPGYDWIAVVSKYEETRFELTFNAAMDDWIGTRVGFTLVEQNGAINVEFYHTGWRERSEHFKISSYCWAMYLRLLRRFVELGEVVEYERRNDI
jgi:uncharacterized protein YndB with AHSA1/START domain